jgi:hypothetical protein
MDKEDIKAIGFGFCLLYTAVDSFPRAFNIVKEMINPTKIQEDYVVPSKLEIGLEDLDKNGEKETIMNYDGKNYLFKVDEKGKPYVQLYGIVPKE